jgi:hypothetical protein
MMTEAQEDELFSLLLLLAKRRLMRAVRRPARYVRLERAPEADLQAARIIAANKSKQTGKNVQNFLSGRYDHAFGVQCVLAGMRHARSE